MRIKKYKEDYKQLLEKLVKESNSTNEVLVKLNKNTSSSSYNTIKRDFDFYKINISHFLTRSEMAKRNFADKFNKRVLNNEIFVENSTFARGLLRSRIIKNNLLSYVCCLCGQDEIWRDKRMSLILDHINGIRNDNRLKNLRFVCPNCNATLETHCLGQRKPKDKLPKEKHLYFSNREYKPIYKLRKVERPTKEELKVLLEDNTFRGLGRKLGVSDNAIRKWAKIYNLL